LLGVARKQRLLKDVTDFLGLEQDEIEKETASTNGLHLELRGATIEEIW